MRKSIATITTLALAALTYTPSNSALASTSPVLAELLVEDSHVDSGYDVTLAVTRAPEGDVIGDATVVDSTTGDEVDMWTDGVTVAWVGVVDGAPTAGEMAVAGPGDRQSRYGRRVVLHPRDCACVYRRSGPVVQFHRLRSLHQLRSAQRYSEPVRQRRVRATAI